ncbi:Crp/Fnr family transcriptional regulator [Kitasatospora sp. NPDC059160]|uniref:Crp/Fnr family transcriptional regulator n=1 Tax=Kitasatospora sp. NPDC059160 TaxID=3346748 RepID=UPI0036A4AC5B
MLTPGERDSRRSRTLADLITGAGGGAAVRFRPGQTLMRQGDPGTHVLLLRGGSAKVTLRSRTGAEVVLALRTAPQILGERAVLARACRSASASALTVVDALAVPGADFRNLVDASPQAMAAVLGITVDRLQEADRGRLELATRTVTQRLAARLLALLPQIGATDQVEGAVRLPLTQQDLADWVGASREAVVRTLRQLRADGIVATERGQIVVHGQQALRELAGS